MPNQNQLPPLPTFQFATPPTGGFQFDPASVLAAIQKAPMSLTNMALPYMQGILGQQSQFVQPQVQAIRTRGEELAATAQSESMRRGMTGSDIEAAAMQAPRAEAQTQEAQLLGQVGMQQAQTMAAQTMQSLGFDIQQNQQLFTNLAQAIGQELSSRRQQEMFYAKLDQALKIARETGDTSLLSAIIQAAGTVGGAIAGSYLGPAGTVAGATAGQQAAKAAT